MLSLVIPGAGQMYRGKVGAGLVWLFATVAGYFMYIFPGLLLHIICIVNAASAEKARADVVTTPVSRPLPAQQTCPHCHQSLRADTELVTCYLCGGALGGATAP